MTKEKTKKESNSGTLATTFYLVDSANKRRNKRSTPTLLLGVIERYPDSTAKEIENRTVNGRSKSILSNYESANNVRKAKGFTLYPNLRAYITARLTAVIRYYTASDVIEGTFNGSIPLIRTITDGKTRYRLGVVST